MKGLKKANLSINDYILNIKLLIYELQEAECGVSEEEKLMSVLGVLDENYDNVFSTLTGRMMNETIITYDAKAFLQIHGCKIECRKIIQISSLPSVNLSVKNSGVTVNND